MAWGKCGWPVKSVDGMGLVWTAWDGYGRLGMGVDGEPGESCGRPEMSVEGLEWAWTAKDGSGQLGMGVEGLRLAWRAWN